MVEAISQEASQDASEESSDDEKNTKIKRGRKPKYLHVITLSGVNAKNIHKRYKQHISDGTNCPNIAPKISTKKQNFFYNVEKNDRFIIMKDHIDFGCLPYTTDLRCWHDHHTFTTSPIGIPIKYVPKKNIDESTTHDIYSNDYFLTVGVVCSFPCLLAYIQNNSDKQLFKQSFALAHLMYRKLYNCDLNIVPASDPMCLKEYGGNVSIEKYREEFCSCTYIITENIKRPYMISVGNWVEEKRCGVL